MKHQSMGEVNQYEYNNILKKEQNSETNFLNNSTNIKNNFDVDEARLVLKLCSLFLQYPSKDLITNTEIEDTILMLKNKFIKDNLTQFKTYLKETPFEKLTENYVQTFDFTEQASLYLTHKVFGDNRERGLAFVKLKMEFAKAGFYIKNDELPDFLPLILEFATIAKKNDVRKVFLIHKKAIDELFAELDKNNSPYARLLETCLTVLEMFLHDKADCKHDAS